VNLNEMRLLVRRDLRDEDESNYRWTDDELNQQIDHTVKNFSEAFPLEEKTTLATNSGTREISLSGLADKVMIEGVEYPIGRFPPSRLRFSVWQDTLTFICDEIPDGSNCYVYWGKLHTLDATTSTIPVRFEELIVGGACGRAAILLAVDTINKVNIGGSGTAEELLNWGLEKLKYFRSELKRLNKKNRVRVKQFYLP
jgi:hypothetical protein